MRITSSDTERSINHLRSALIAAGVIPEDSPKLYVQQGNSSYAYAWQVYTSAPKGLLGTLVVESYGTRKDFYNATKAATRALDLVNS